MLLGVLRFIAFLLFFIVYVVALAKLTNLIGRARQGGRTYIRLLYGQAQILVAWLGTFGLVWVLSGFWDTGLVLLGVLATETAVLLGLLLGAVSWRRFPREQLLQRIHGVGGETSGPLEDRAPSLTVIGNAGLCSRLRYLPAVPRGR